MRLLPLLLLLPTLALGQGLTPLAPGQTGGGKTLLSLSLDTTGALITEDANTVAHVYWNGTALVDTKGNSWTMSGTVPQVTANPFTTTRYGAGPLTASNYYSLGTGSDVFDFAGDFTVCAVYSAPSSGFTGSIIAAGWYGASGEGWATLINSGTSLFFDTYAAGSGYRRVAATTGLAAPGAQIGCFGRSGATQYVKLSLGSTVSGTAYTTPGTSYPTRISGPDFGAGTAAFTGTIYEVYATSTPWSESNVTAIQQKVLGHLYGTTALSVTRSTTATVLPRAADCATGQCIWNVPANVARIEENGLLVEPARSNAVLYSSALTNGGTGAGTGWALSAATVATVAGAPDGSSWASVTSTTKDGYLYPTSTTLSATTHVASAWIRKGAGTGYAAIGVWRNATPTTVCSCVRSDGGACTASAAGSDACIAKVSDLGITPIRLSVIVARGTAHTDPFVSLYPGDQGVATGTSYFGAVQLEVGTYPTSYIPTTGTSASRAADQVSVTNPIPTGTSKWCVAGDFKPYGGRAWADASLPMLWALGNTGFPNTGFIYNPATANEVRLWINDASTNAKTATASSALLASGGHRVVGCDASGTLALAVDGATLSATLAGSGTGLISTQPPFLYVGYRGDGLSFGGYIKNFKVCSNAKTAKDCK